MDQGRPFDTRASPIRTSSFTTSTLPYVGASKNPRKLPSVHPLALLIPSCRSIARWRLANVVRDGAHTMGLGVQQLLLYLVVLRPANGLHHAMKGLRKWTAISLQRDYHGVRHRTSVEAATASRSCLCRSPPRTDSSWSRRMQLTTREYLHFCSPTVMRLIVCPCRHPRLLQR